MSRVEKGPFSKFAKSLQLPFCKLHNCKNNSVSKSHRQALQERLFKLDVISPDGPFTGPYHAAAYCDLDHFGQSVGPVDERLFAIPAEYGHLF